MGRPISDGVTTHYCTVVETAKTGRAYFEEDQLVLDAMKNNAELDQFAVEIVDISTLKGRLRALSKGVKETPTVIVDGIKIEGYEALELVKNRPPSYLRTDNPDERQRKPEQKKLT